MKVEYILSSTYNILEHRKGRYRLVKVIGDYDSKEKALKDLLFILERIVPEEEIEAKWRKRKEQKE